MTRQQLIDRIKYANENFFDRKTRRFFGDSKYRWLTKDKRLVIEIRKHGMFRIAEYTWDENYKLISIFKQLRKENQNETSN